MGTQSALLNLSQNSLLTSQAAIEITSNNVTNANTLGIHRGGCDLAGERYSPTQQPHPHRRRRDRIGCLAARPGAQSADAATEAACLVELCRERRSLHSAVDLRAHFYLCSSCLHDTWHRRRAGLAQGFLTWCWFSVGWGGTDGSCRRRIPRQDRQPPTRRATRQRSSSSVRGRG